MTVMSIKKLFGSFYFSETGTYLNKTLCFQKYVIIFIKLRDREKWCFFLYDTAVLVVFGFGWVLTRGLLFVYCRWFNNIYGRLFQPKRYKLLHILISDNIQISHEYVLYSCICACHVQILILMWLLGGYLFIL